MERVMEGFRGLVVDNKVAEYLPERETDLEQIRKTFEIVVERTEEVLEELQQKDLNRELLEVVYEYLLNKVLAELTTKPSVS